MEEASLDHGLDRLRFFFFVPLLLLFSHASAWGTTFGPISVHGQVSTSNYIVHGRIDGPSWVEMERHTQRPYTYWKLAVIEQLKGGNLGDEVTITQPGGEIGGLGYHVAGTADFSPGEEVFVNLKDTNEAGVKEVVGLTSGKITITTDKDGHTILVNGLGFVMKDAQGQPLTPESYRALVKRILDHQDTAADKSILINNTVTHGEGAAEEEPPPHPSPLAVLPVPHSHAPLSLLRTPNPAQEIPPAAEKPKGTLGWAALLVLGVAVLAGLIFLWMR